MEYEAFLFGLVTPILAAAFLIGLAAIVVILLSRGRLKGLGFALAAILIVGLSTAGLVAAGDAKQQASGRLSRWHPGAAITGAHLFLVTFTRDADAAKHSKAAPEPLPAEAMGLLQERDTIEDGVRRASGRRPPEAAVLEIMATMRAEYFTKPARVTVGPRTIDIPAHTAAFFIVDRSPDQGLGAGAPMGWSIIESASHGWRHRKHLNVTGTQVLSAPSLGEFKFER